MNEMIERIAAILMERRIERHKKGVAGIAPLHALNDAVAILEAMRNPTDAMSEAGADVGQVSICFAEAEHRYQAMIDEALHGHELVEPNPVMAEVSRLLQETNEKLENLPWKE